MTINATLWTSDGLGGGEEFAFSFAVLPNTGDLVMINIAKLRTRKIMEVAHAVDESGNPHLMVQLDRQR
jgi:hypothetical protein